MTHHLLGPEYMDMLLYADDLEALGIGPKGRQGYRCVTSSSRFGATPSSGRKLGVATAWIGSGWKLTLEPQAGHVSKAGYLAIPG